MNNFTQALIYHCPQETPDIMEGAMPLLQVSKAIVGIAKAPNPVKPVATDL